LGAAAPELRGTDQKFASRLFGAGVTRTNALESLVISGWVRGLSDRDIEAALAEVLGPEAALSRSTVSRIASGSRASSKCGAPATCPACAWTTCSWTPATSGCASKPRPSRCWPPGHRYQRQAGVRWPRASQLGVDRRLGPLPRRPHRAWLRPPPGVSDDAPGLLGAIERHFPNSLRPAVPGAPRQERARQGIGPRPSRGQGRLLSDLRRR
jgi:putative transposase